MRKVITYGTFDLLHSGHINLLRRAKELGDYLVVGVTSDSYDKSRGKLNVKQNIIERIQNVLKLKLADEIIIEEYEGQKIDDIIKKKIDVFAIGSDWQDKFDYLKKFCEVVYLERTKGISSTELRNFSNGIIKLGIIGYGRIAERFIAESKYVSGVEISYVFGLNKEKGESFVTRNQLLNFFTNFDEFIGKVDAVYIATPHQFHYDYIMKSLSYDKHVLCEKPMVLKESEAIEVFELAKSKKLVLLEAIKTVFSPGFIRLTSLIHTGIIGEVKHVEATFTKLVNSPSREVDDIDFGGSLYELGSYPLIAIMKILGYNYEDVVIKRITNNKIDIFTEVDFKFRNALANAYVGLGVKKEGNLIISGTNGYIYVDSPWWKTEFFEARYEDLNLNRKFYYKFEGDGLRYELAEFIKMINNCESETFLLNSVYSITLAKIMEISKKEGNMI